MARADPQVPVFRLSDCLHGVGAGIRLGSSSQKDTGQGRIRRKGKSKTGVLIGEVPIMRVLLDLNYRGFTDLLSPPRVVLF
jgi:hypothetical protein